jgi:YD repeat-containing protein
MNAGRTTYFGIMRGHTSWGKVGREMVLALVDKGADVNIYERKGFLYDENMTFSTAVEKRITQTFRDDAVFTFEHPGVYGYLRGRLKVGMLCYESTVVPPHWVEHVNRYLDLLLVPTTFCRDIFAAGGVPEAKMEVIPYGFSKEIYCPDGPVLPFPRAAERSWRFLTVACPHKRKGIATVLAAYEQAFAPADDVSLVVKLNYLPGRKTRPFEHGALEAELRAFAADPNKPALALISDYLPENDLAALYRGASCLVSATRGEGFGMVYLEALACGLPVIVTGWGGHMDFINNDNARVVKYTLRPAAEIQYDCDSADALIAEPDAEDLSRAMRESYNARHHPPRVAPPESLEPYAWPHLADRFLTVTGKRVATLPGMKKELKKR